MMALEGKGSAQSRQRNKTKVTEAGEQGEGCGRWPEISCGHVMQGLLGSGQDLGLDSKNSGKPGKGLEHGCGVVRFAYLEEHPGCNAEKE